MTERWALYKLHHDVRSLGLRLFSSVKNRYNSRVQKTPGHLGFVKKTLPVLLLFGGVLVWNRDGFDGNETVDLRVARFIDHSHRAVAQFGDNLVAS